MELLDPLFAIPNILVAMEVCLLDKKTSHVDTGTNARILQVLSYNSYHQHVDLSGSPSGLGNVGCIAAVDHPAAVAVSQDIRKKGCYGQERPYRIMHHLALMTC
jgi:hypothetical protein